MRPIVSRTTTPVRFDFQNALVLLIGWVVALAVTWT